MVEVVDMAAAQLPAALALNNANVPEVNELDAAELARLHGFAAASLCAVDDDVLAGFCLVYGPGADYASLNYRWFSERYEEFVYLDRIAVAGSHRRRGIGRQFYAELLDRFRGVQPVLLCEVNVRPRNEPSLAFHHQIGFREVGQQDTDHGTRVSLLALPLT